MLNQRSGSAGVGAAQKRSDELGWLVRASRGIAIGCTALWLCGTVQAQVLFGNMNVGQASSPVVVTVTLPHGGTVTSVKALTLGESGLDYASLGDNCVGLEQATPGQQCTAMVTFSPTASGQRSGALVVLNGNTVLGTTYISGVGVGGLGVMTPGTIITAVGNGDWTALNDGGAPTSANLYLPKSVAFDGAGNLYIADSVHNRVRMVTGASPQTISTIAGGDQGGYAGDYGPASQAELDSPTSVAVDGAGNVYVADSGNNVVRKIDGQTHVITTVVGTGTAGFAGDGAAATEANLNSPMGVTLDSGGNLFIADQKNQRVRMVATATGVITTVVGNGAPGGNGQGTFSGDGGQAVSAGLSHPFAVGFDVAGNMYIPDSANNVIRIVNKQGIIQTFAGNAAAGAGFSGDGGQATSAQLYSPSGVLVDVAGDVLISDTQNNRIRSVSPTGVIYTLAGDGTGKYAGDNGNALDAELYGPYGMAMDALGNLVFADYFDHRIREIPSSLAILSYTPATRVGQKSATQQQGLKNLGNGPLSLKSMAAGQNAAIDASQTTCLAAPSLAIAATCQVGAVFAPTVAGNPQQGNILLETQDANGPLDIELTGQALALNATVTTLQSNANPSAYGQTIGLTATVTAGANTGALEGQVTFYDGQLQLGSPVTVNNAGIAALSVSTLAIGAHSLTASFTGDPQHTSSVSLAVSQTVEEATLTTLTPSSNPAELHAPVTLTAIISPKAGTITPSGTVAFFDGPTELGTVLIANGQAALSVSSLAAGLHSLTAVYGGMAQSYILGSTSAPLNLDVQAQSSIALSSSLNPSAYGDAVQLRTTVLADGASATTGTVQFTDGGVALGSASVAGGVAVLQLSTLAAGQHIISAVYSANAYNAASTSQMLVQVVSKTTTQIVVSYNPDPAIGGKTVTLQAIVSVLIGAGIPTGRVSFRDGSAMLGDANLSGSGMATLSLQLATGAHSIVATYAGDANNGADVSETTPLQVVPAMTQVNLSTSQNPIVADAMLTISAHVTGDGGIPGGRVSFLADSHILGSTVLDGTGVATYTVSTLALGTHALTASYSGDVNDAESTSLPTAETVAPISTVTTIGSVTNVQKDLNLLLAATVVGASGPAPTGTVNFLSNGQAIGSAVIDDSGVATLTPTLNSGSITIVAEYAGDALHAASQSTPISVTTGGVGFNVLAPPSITMATTQNATITITLQSTNGFADMVGLGCAGLPAMMSCHFSNDKTSLNANGIAAVRLTIDTNAPVSGGAEVSDLGPRRGISLAGLAMPVSAVWGLVLWRARRKKVASLLLTLVFSGMAICGLEGCAGLSVNSVTPGAYTVQITAAGTQSDVMRTVILTVNVTK